MRSSNEEPGRGTGGSDSVVDETGPWIDMSTYPDLDPDCALSLREWTVLHHALVVAEPPLLGDLWERMLHDVIGESAVDLPGTAPTSPDDPHAGLLVHVGDASDDDYNIHHEAFFFDADA